MSSGALTIEITHDPKDGAKTVKYYTLDNMGTQEILAEVHLAAAYVAVVTKEAFEEEIFSQVESWVNNRNYLTEIEKLAVLDYLCKAVKNITPNFT